MEVDHDRGEVYAETMELTVSPSDIGLPSEEAVAARLMSPIVTTYIDTDKISFERWDMDSSWKFVFRKHSDPHFCSFIFDNELSFEYYNEL